MTWLMWFGAGYLAIALGSLCVILMIAKFTSPEDRK